MCEYVLPEEHESVVEHLVCTKPLFSRYDRQTCQLLRFGRSLLRPSDRCYGATVGTKQATVTYKFSSNEEAQRLELIAYVVR